jgi:hypothetical protein
MLNVKSIVLILVILVVLAVLFFFFVLTRVPVDFIQILMSNGLAMHERKIPSLLFLPLM